MNFIQINPLILHPPQIAKMGDKGEFSATIKWPKIKPKPNLSVSYLKNLDLFTVNYLHLAFHFVRFNLGMNCRTILIQFILCYVTSNPKLVAVLC